MKLDQAKSLVMLMVFMLCVITLHAADYFIATNGSDSGIGAAAQPFRTIQKGLDSAGKAGDTVTVLPGIYSEELLLRTRGEPDKPIVIKAAKKQTVILDGAERVTGWSLLDSRRNIWEKKFGTQAPYNDDHGRWDLAPRSEQVFVNGQHCTHLKDDTASGTMPDYSFTATLTNLPQYVLKLPQGLNPNTAITEITVKTSLLKVRSDNVVIDGFVFRRVRNTYQNAMVTLSGEAIEFRNNLVEYSSAGSGLAIQTHCAHIHANNFRNNGQFGFAVGGSENLIENNLVQGNDLAGYKEWGTGGTKIVGNGNIIRRNRFIDNLGGVAIWLDCGPANSVIEDNYVSGNYGEGIRAEISFHSYIGYNIVENTRECVPVMFGKTQRPHCIGISVQNSAEICVVNNFLKDNRGVGIQLSTYSRKASDLARWQERHADEQHKQWLHRSWSGGFVYAYSNMFFNNVIVQSTAEVTGPCVYLMGLTNGQMSHCFGNLFDYNFYWNSVTHAPKVQTGNATEVPSAKSGWQTRFGMDLHALGGFSPQDYRQPAFSTAYPYKPSAGFTGISKGRDLKDLSWPHHSDYLGNPLHVGRNPSIGHIEPPGK